MIGEKVKTDEEYFRDMALIDPTIVTFQRESRFGEYYGTLTLTGYLDVETIVCEPGNPCGETVDYAFFVITDTDNKAIDQFIADYHGNAFVFVREAKVGLGLGCYQKDQERIFSINGSMETSIFGEDLTKLVSSTETNPVSIKLTMPFTYGGKGAPACYSHFRNFEIL